MVPGNPEPGNLTMPKTSPLVGAIVAVTLATPANAQEQDTADVDLWGSTLDLAVTSASGNENLTVITSDLNLTRLVPDIVEIVAAGRNRYGESGDSVVARNFKGSLRFNFRPQGHWAPSLFADAEHDPFKRLDLRLNAGGGAQYTITRSETRQAAISGAVLYSYENLAPPAGSTVETSEENARWKWQFEGRQQLTEGMEVTQNTEYQPVWDRANDYLLEAETTLRVRLTSNLALTLSHVYQRNSTPPSGVRADDQLIRMGVSFSMDW